MRAQLPRLRLCASWPSPTGSRPADPAELVARNHAEAVLTLGDLRPEWLASLSGVGVPRLGVHGNHDGEHQLQDLGIQDLHLSRTELSG
jgi:hypothetical protein